MSAGLRIVVDEREAPSGVPALLKGMGLQVEHRMLEVGDYVVSSDCAIERKEARDFFQSLYSHRLFDQVYHLSEAYEHPVLIVEGDPTVFMNSMSRPRTFWGALVTLSFQYGLSLFFTLDTHQTADLIYTLATRRRFVRPKRPLVQKKPRAGTLEKSQLLMVSSLPGIGSKLADRALERFGTVRRIFFASVAELSTVNGIGRITAEKISAYLDAPYHPIIKPPRQLSLDKT